ncbi:DMSO/TMAO reductase YedYZ molybdopterin-dependent catalytic subunit [Kitasatospora gansuensis]|uniref:DMSO/TMAO reductase YedYZ molybdopterin-dependent catalytic subunit n=2 Tax=Kitasatospora gansuensis TaxID=258050 RepID=A0A7W7WGH8_9ACTN|nr:DMSO/TMAO reductase YedYZ molybdopterin-dependent catalytic subunit [Kitasatospora gansuensis]
MDEFEYDRVRRHQWLAGQARADGVDRRTLLRMTVAAGALAAPFATMTTASAAPSAGPGIVKPLPAEWFVPRGTNAEMRWDAVAGTGHHTPTERFFVRNHTRTPLIDPDGWRLRLTGSGLRRGEVEFGLDDLRRLPSTRLNALIECAGNGRSYYTSRQQQPVPGTPWTLGGVGSARWRGVRLADLLHRAGLRRDAVDVLPTGLDDEYLTASGANLGRVRRPLPVGKALDDVLVAYEMNGEPLTPDHGAPVRLVVPGWVGIASIKWLGSVEVATEPLYSPWNTQYYRLFGPAHPAGGSAPLTRQVVKSAFELAPDAVLPAGRRHRLTGRSWSGAAAIRQVEVSTDGGTRWQPARLLDEPRPNGWVRWSHDWRPERPGPYELRARATDRRGNTQPDVAVFNTEGYLFDAVVAHPVTVAQAAS